MSEAPKADPAGAGGSGAAAAGAAAGDGAPRAAPPGDPPPPVAGTAPPAPAAADEDDPSNCPICRYIEEGPCSTGHVDWRLCKGAARREGPGVDWVERCSGQVSAAGGGGGGGGA
jgi:hypothetical protein